MSCPYISVAIELFVHPIGNGDCTIESPCDLMRALQIAATGDVVSSPQI